MATTPPTTAAYVPGPIPVGTPATDTTPKRRTPIGGSAFQYAADPNDPGKVWMLPQPTYDPTTGQLLLDANGKPQMTSQPVPWTANRPAGAPVVSRLGGEAAGRVDPLGGGRINVAPRYYEGDADILFNDLTPGARAQLQDEMIAAKIYGSKNPNIVHGVMDAETRSAFNQVLQTANATGYDYETVIQNYQQIAKSQPPAPPTPHVNTVTNTTDLVSVFKTASRAALGREISDAEAKRYAAAYQGQQTIASDAINAAQDAGVNATVQTAPSADAFLTDQLKTNNPGEFGANQVANQFDTFTKLLRGAG